jgi:hypothetical protein
MGKRKNNPVFVIRHPLHCKRINGRTGTDSSETSNWIPLRQKDTMVKKGFQLSGVHVFVFRDQAN